MNKDQIIAELTKLGVPHDAKANQKTLQALLDWASQAANSVGAPQDTQFDLTTREGRWERFKALHAKQNPKKHAVRAAAGELDAIPETFL